MNNPHDCARFHYLVGACRFEPRYDVIPPEKIGPLDTNVEGAVQFLNAASKRIYVHDVCVRCGKVTKR